MKEALAPVPCIAPIHHVARRLSGGWLVNRWISGPISGTRFSLTFRTSRDVHYRDMIGTQVAVSHLVLSANLVWIFV